MTDDEDRSKNSPHQKQEDIMTGLAQEFKDDWYKKGKTEKG